MPNDLLNKCFKILQENPKLEGDLESLLRVLGEYNASKGDDAQRIQGFQKKDIILYLIDNFDQALVPKLTDDDALTDTTKETEHKAKLAQFEYLRSQYSSRKSQALVAFGDEAKKAFPLNDKETREDINAKRKKFIEAKIEEYEKRATSPQEPIKQKSTQELKMEESRAIRKNAIAAFFDAAEQGLSDIYDENILQKIISVPTKLGKDIVLQIIDKVDDDALQQRVERKDEDFCNLLEYLVNEECYGKDFPEISEIVVKLIERGLTIGDDYLPILMRQRSMESGLLMKVCKYYIDRNNADLFCKILEYVEAKTKKDFESKFEVAGSSRRRSSVASPTETPVSIDNQALIQMFQVIINDALKSELINSAVTQHKETIPAFLLRESESEGISKIIWEDLQSKRNMALLTPQVFQHNSRKLHGGNFLHYIIESGNITLLKAATEIVNKSSPADQKEIYSAIDKKGRTPFHKACFKGFDEGIKSLMREDLLYLVDCKGLTPLATIADKGFGVSFDVFWQHKPDGFDINCQEVAIAPLAVAAMTSHERLARKLLDIGANPNARSTIIDANGKTIITDALQEATKRNNIFIVRNLIAKGVNLKGEDGRKLLHYKAFEKRNQADLSESAMAEENPLLLEAQGAIRFLSDKFSKAIGEEGFAYDGPKIEDAKVVKTQARSMFADLISKGVDDNYRNEVELVSKLFFGNHYDQVVRIYLLLGLNMKQDQIAAENFGLAGVENAGAKSSSGAPTNGSAHRPKVDRLMGGEEKSK